MTTARKLGAATAVALLVLLLFLLLGSRAAPARKPATARASATVETPTAHLTSSSVVPAVDGEEELQHAPAVVIGRPLIDGVDIAPQRLCVGRPILVNVHAHDPDGRDGELVTDVNGDSGAYNVQYKTLPGKHWLMVAVTNQRGDTDQRPVEIQVDACTDADPWLHVTTFTTLDAGLMGFRASTGNGAALDGGWHYSWQFGDGTEAMSDLPYIEHDYRGRDQVGYQSNYQVRVVASRREQKLEGFGAVALRNLYAYNRLKKGMIVVDVVPLGAGVRGDTAFIRATLRHWEAHPLTLDDVQATATGGAQGDRPLDLGLANLSERVLPGGASEMVVTFPAATVGDATAVLLDVRGKDAHGLPVFVSLGGAFGTRQGVAVASHTQVHGDPEMVARTRALEHELEHAAALLGLAPGDPIPQADIDRLVREGRIAPITPPPLTPTP